MTTTMTTTPTAPTAPASVPGRVVDNSPDQLVRVGLYVVVLACIVASGDVLIYLAHHAGWNDWRGYLLPVLIDLPGFLGGRIWLRKKPTSPETRQYARRLTVAALGASIVGNVVGHLVKGDHVPAGIGLVIVASAIAPVVLWAVLHLDALLTPTTQPVAAARSAGVESATREPSVPAGEPTSRAVPKHTGQRSKPKTRTATGSRAKSAKATDVAGTEAQAAARVLWDTAIAEGRIPSGAELARAAGVDPSMGRRWRRDWEQETTTTTTTTDAAAVGVGGAGTDDSGSATEERAA
jgi:hypothetical protein